MEFAARHRCTEPPSSDEGGRFVAARHLEQLFNAMAEGLRVDHVDNIITNARNGAAEAWWQVWCRLAVPDAEALPRAVPARRLQQPAAHVAPQGYPRQGRADHRHVKPALCRDMQGAHDRAQDPFETRHGFRFNPAGTPAATTSAARV